MNLVKVLVSLDSTDNISALCAFKYVPEPTSLLVLGHGPE